MSFGKTGVFSGQPTRKTPVHIWNQRWTEQHSNDADNPERKCSGQNAYESSDPAVFKSTAERESFWFLTAAETHWRTNSNTQTEIPLSDPEGKEERTIPKRDRCLPLRERKPGFIRIE